MTVVKSRGRSFVAVDAGKAGSARCARRWDLWVDEEEAALMAGGERLYVWPPLGAPASIFADVSTTSALRASHAGMWQSVGNSVGECGKLC